MKTALSLASAFLIAACASIHSVETTTDTPLHPTIRHEIEDGSVQYEVVSTTVIGYELEVVLEQSETCTTITTQRVHRRRYVDRQLDSTATRLTWGLALAGLGGGAYGYLDAGDIASRSMDGTTPDEVRQYAGGMIVIGTLAAIVGIIDATRATDSELDDGVIKSRPTRESGACRRRRTGNADVTLALANGFAVHARTDDDGLATFSFLNVPEDGLPTLATRVSVVIGAAHVPVVGFESGARSQMRETLLAEPRSQLAIQVLERRREACIRAVDTARASVPAEPADVPISARSSWLDAKSACSDLWTAQFESELDALEQRVVNSECRDRLERAGAAFGDDSGTTVGEMTDELATLHAMCTTPESVSKLHKLDAALAATVKRFERDAAAAAQRAAREKARAAAAYRDAIERARAQRSFTTPDPEWSPSTTRTCCKVCSAGKACGNSCIARWKTCHKGVGCACDE